MPPLLRAAAALSHILETEARHRRIPNKGLGAVAKRSIQMGERLLAEAPIVANEPHPGTSAEDAVKALPEANRALFFSLAQNAARFGDSKTVFGVFATAPLTSPVSAALASNMPIVCAA